MIRAFLVAATLTAAACLPLVASAQSLTDLVSPENGGTAGQSQPAPQQQQAQTDAPAPGLNTGTPLEDGGVAVGESYQRGTFDDWTLTCIKTGRETEPCRLAQNLTDEAGGSVARVEIFPTGDGGIAVGAAVLAPLGTLLTRGVRMTVPDGETKLYPFIVCNRESCIAEFGLLPEEVDAMKAGATVDIVIVAAAASETPVRLSLSLQGFTAAYEEFETLTAGLF